ncbi:cell division protein FtsB [Sedimenticola sp.]|uniref:cell division protein FtsB n=1 Tax=Sedimenticola sp. TaxID=1940285 RepID=UPI003D13681D
MMIRILILLLFAMLVVLQYRLWVGEGSLAELHLLKQDIAQQKDELQQMRRRNQALQAEVDDLKKGLEAIEERARNDLGMIREGEIFYQIIEPQQGKP